MNKEQGTKSVAKRGIKKDKPLKYFSGLYMCNKNKFL